MTATLSARSTTSRQSSTAETSRSRRRILLRGVTLLQLGALLAALLLLPPLLRGAVPAIPVVLVAAAALGAGGAVRDRWWVLRIYRDELDDALIRSCRMVRAWPAITPEGVRLQVADAELMIRIRARGSGAFQLRFDGPWRAQRKATLLRSVIAKQFEPPLPRIRIRLRRFA
jgi:hypothetical protein